MSLIPLLKIGVLNGWILMLYPLIHPMLIMLIVKDAMQKMQVTNQNKAEKLISTFVLLNKNGIPLEVKRFQV